MASVFAWGANSHGQLGLGYESELCMSPQKVNKLSFSANNVKRIRGGGGHVLILDNLGHLHACGWNNRGQLGLDSNDECHNEFQPIPREFFEDAAVETMACGWDISGCITSHKTLYVWGSNAFQQLGICQRGFTAVRRPLAVHLPRDDIPKRISFGLRHCGILTEDSKVYVFGRFRIPDPFPMELTITHTTLNRADVIKIQPKNSNDLQIINIISGQNHLILTVVDSAFHQATAVRRIIALGDNKFCQGNSFRFEDDVKQVAVGWTHNCVLLKDKRLFVWGRNCYGQLGIGSYTDVQASPLQLKLKEDLEPSFLHLGSEHALLRTTNGDVYTWGWNEHGNCGIDSTSNVCTPQRVELPGVCKLAGAGAGFCYAICENIQ